MQVKKYHSYIIIITRMKTKYRVVHIYHNLKKRLRACRIVACEQKGHKMYQHLLPECLPHRVKDCSLCANKIQVGAPLLFPSLGSLSPPYANNCVLTHVADLFLCTLCHERDSVGIRELSGSLNLRVLFDGSIRLRLAYLQSPNNKCTQKGHS